MRAFRDILYSRVVSATLEAHIPEVCEVRVELQLSTLTVPSQAGFFSTLGIADVPQNVNLGAFQVSGLRRLRTIAGTWSAFLSNLSEEKIHAARYASPFKGPLCQSYLIIRT